MDNNYQLTGKERLILNLFVWVMGVALLGSWGCQIMPPWASYPVGIILTTTIFLWTRGKGNKAGGPAHC